MKRLFPSIVVLSCLLGVAALPQWARGGSPSALQALKLTPVQPGVDYDRPTPEQAAKCKIIAKRINGHVGWIVESPDGVMLRKFVEHQR